MIEIVALAAGVPAAVGAAWRVTRRRRQLASPGEHGIALQTVIVIVVMLVIAGGVAGVLLTRSSEVVGDLERQEVGPVTEVTCPTIDLVDSANDDRYGVWADTTGGGGTCTWTASTTTATFSRTACSTLQGVYTSQNTADTCVVTIT